MGLCELEGSLVYTAGVREASAAQHQNRALKTASRHGHVPLSAALSLRHAKQNRRKPRKIRNVLSKE